MGLLSVLPNSEVPSRICWPDASGIVSICNEHPVEYNRRSYHNPGSCLEAG